MRSWRGKNSILFTVTENVSFNYDLLIFTNKVKKRSIELKKNKNKKISSHCSIKASREEPIQKEKQFQLESKSHKKKDKKWDKWWEPEWVRVWWAAADGRDGKRGDGQRRLPRDRRQQTGAENGRTTATAKGGGGARTRERGRENETRQYP